MTNSPPITRFIGKAERTLQALLQGQLQKTGMSFPEGVALTILSGGQLTAEGLAQAIADARVVVPGREMTVVDDLIGKLDLIAELDLGDERKHHGDGEPKLALMGQLPDLPVDGLAKGTAGFLAEGSERFHQRFLLSGCA